MFRGVRGNDRVRIPGRLVVLLNAWGSRGGESEVVEFVPVAAVDSDGELFAGIGRSDRVIQGDGWPGTGSGRLRGFRHQGVGPAVLGEQLDTARVGARAFKVILEREGFVGNQSVG